MRFRVIGVIITWVYITHMIHAMAHVTHTCSFVHAIPPKKVVNRTVFLFRFFRYGYRGRDCRTNLFVLSSGELIYFTAAVVVLYDVPNHKQRHYTEHTDDIKR